MNAKQISYGLAASVFAMLIGICPFPAAAADDDSANETPRFIERFDQNDDGVVTIEEFPGPERRFDSLDSNGDGTISADEAPQGPPPRRPDPATLIADFDKDGDGQLSLDEFPGPDRHFERMDSDEDGALTEEELKAGRSGRRCKRNWQESK